MGSPLTLEIVKRLAGKGELTCAALEVPIAKSTLSHHFRVLRESGIVYCRKEGTQHFNSLQREELEALFPGLLDTVLQVAKPLEVN